MSIYILSYFIVFWFSILGRVPRGNPNLPWLGGNFQPVQTVMNRPVCVLQTQIKSLSATIGIRVPEVAVGGRWRPDLRAFGIPFTDNATQWGCPRCGANVFAWKPACFKCGKVCSKSWGLYPSPAPYEWHWCQWWCGSRVVWGGSPPPVICSTTTTTHTQHTQIHRFQTGDRDPFGARLIFAYELDQLPQLRVLCSYTPIHQHSHHMSLIPSSFHSLQYLSIRFLSHVFHPGTFSIIWFVAWPC